MSSIPGRSCGYRVDFDMIFSLHVIVARAGRGWRRHGVGEDESLCLRERLHQVASVIDRQEAKDISAVLSLGSASVVSRSSCGVEYVRPVAVERLRATNKQVAATYP